MSNHLSHLAVLDHLRPPPGWRTDMAVLSTYSAHTSVLAAALLALAGQDDESASGTRIGLVRALSELRGKVHFVVQSGRLTLPANPAPVVALLDRFIVQAPFDEGSDGMHNGKSWHAKFALVRHVSVADPEAGERWVFMLGSRNLTLDMSWDLGLVLKAGSDTRVDGKTAAQLIAGVGPLAASLAKLFPALKHWSVFAGALDKAHWQVPLGMTVTQISLMLPDDGGRRMPEAPKDISRVLAVSPFLDSKAVATLARWGSDETQRELLSIRPELAKLAGQSGKALEAYGTLLVLPEAVIDNRSDTAIAADDEIIAADQTGLHAKFIYAEHLSGSTLWLGSANLTGRAWSRNSECYACVVINDALNDASKTLLAGLNAFIEMAQPLMLAELQDQAAEETPAMRLSSARVHVAARMAGAVQKTVEGVATVQADGLPHPVDEEIELFCGRLMEAPTLWPRNLSVLALPHAEHQVTDSDCVRISLVLGAERVEWVQVVAWSPSLDMSRDEAVLSDYLGPRQMLAWIHDVLTGYANGDEGGAWDEPMHTAKSTARKALAIGLPSMEQALRLWLKDRTKLDEVDRILAIWQKRRAAAVVDPEMEKHLLQFTKTWGALRKGLAMHKRLGKS
ncbi:conserved hypothetical protein [Pseudomonas sp. 9AZ]|uniref:phospholipase D family protein n=1 Tax=Pseudomonas sp. 9AZ TaxID=2653168 RepID=UPI0012F28618|nr:phospholipase D family protein [Pseudomonas sp. 9AZ]VXC99849.1 conserved hypothetical protein [Pseudomonas sp. 9AZ]